MTYVGGTIEKEVTFRDTSGALADPAVVNGNAKTPSGVSVAGTVVPVSTGVFDVLFVGSEPGLWYWRIEGEGNEVDAVVEGSFCVKASSVE